MPRRITIHPNLSLEELESRYRQAKQATKRIHYQTIWLLAKGKTTAEVAEVTGYSVSWIYELVRSYNRTGPDSLGDMRQGNLGAKPLLNDVQQAQLWQALQSQPADGGLWSGPKVAQWMSDLLGHPVLPQRGWEYLKGLRLRLGIPRPEHQEADAQEQETWKKKLRQETAQLQAEYPDADVEVWAIDEHRLGLKPVIRRVWVDEWTTPTAQVNWRFKWLWLYGFVQPESGQTYWWILPYVRIDLFNRVLADFAQHLGLGKHKRIILTMDQAGWHTSDKVKIPEGVHVVLLPPHSPELQPAERLWPLINEPIVNKSFETLDQLEQVLFRRCQVLLQPRELIRGLTCYHWWPKSVV
jgi:transposase